MGDHARFIYNGLAHKERESINMAAHFIQSYDNLLNRSRMILNQMEILNLTQQAFELTSEFREFKLELLSRHLVEEIDIELSPTFINHMINELEEYLRIMQYIMTMQIPDFHPVHHHLLWLLDGVGHADTLACSLDTVEEKLINRSKEFSKTFQKFYQKAIEMSGYMRTCLKRFPALSRFNMQVENEMTLFMKFLKEIEELELNNKALGILTPLIPDHMYREECYYLTKLSQVSEVKKPNCDATKPRIMSIK